ncbi:MAG: chloride channel protein [Deferribacteres bacterium]|nr:chloride channel protein [Deferribacteres bacterium]
MRKLSLSNSGRFAPVRLSDRAALIFLGVLVGVLAAFGNAAFRTAMDFFTELFFHKIGGYLGIEMGKRHPLVFILPVMGAAISGIFVAKFKDEAKGYGLPRVIKAMLKKGGLIKKRVIIFNVFLPTLVIGSGGSAGREGPIASLGAALGSALGQYIRAHPGRMRVLVAAGAGAAIAAAFDAPIAGMMFALEIILLGNFDIDHFPPLVVSVGTAVVITEALYGREVTFHIPAFSIPNPWVEIPLYAVLGVVIGVASVGFIKLYYFIEERFESLNIPFYGKLILGAFLTGVLGIIFPEVLGNGYGFVEKALRGYYPFVLMGLLGIAKMVATAFTVGSGNPGGLFAPGFFIGAMIAGFFGGLLAHILPVHVGSPGAYASVGIGAFIAGTYHAPLTGIFLLFEMTKDYTIILPALFSCVIASLLAEWLFPYTLDTYALHKMGIEVHHGREPEILESIKVKDAMTKDYDVIWEGASLKQIRDYFSKLAKHTDLFVVDKDGKLVGVIPFVVLRDAIFAERELEDFVVARDLAVTPPVLREDEPLSAAARKIGSRKIDHLPVVDKDGKLVGMISRKYIIDAYNREARKRAQERGLS